MIKQTMKAVDFHRVRALTLQRQIHQENTENNIELKLTESKERQARAEQLIKDETVATEIERRKNDAFKEMKLRQQLRGSSWELRELESKLYTGYCNKEVAAQIAEKEAARLKNKVHEIENNKMMIAQRLKAEMSEKKKLQEYHNKKLQYKKDLDEQMRLLNNKHQREFEEFVREKAALEDITCTVEEESLREKNLKMLKMEQLKKDMEEFKKAQSLWRQREKETIEEEHRNITEYLKKKECEDKSKVDEACKQRQQKILLQEKLAQVIKKETDERLERERVIQDLAVEKSVELQEKKFKAELETAIMKSKLLKESYRQQIEKKKQQLKEEEQFESAYRQQLLETFARDEKLEKMTAEKQRIKKIQYRQQVHEILEERRRRRVDELQRVVALEKLHQIEEEKMHKLIEEERMKMLKTHATNILGFLPKGVVRKDELNCFGT